MSTKNIPNREEWKTAPICPTCEKIEGESFQIFTDKGSMRGFRMCGAPTDYAYPAMGGGWMALCAAHGENHLPYIAPISELIEAGEVFE